MNTQTTTAGTTPEIHPDVTKAAEAYRRARDSRMEATELEVSERRILLEKMREHDLTVYEDRDLNIRVEVIEGEAKVKVKQLESEE